MREVNLLNNYLMKMIELIFLGFCTISIIVIHQLSQVTHGTPKVVKLAKTWHFGITKMASLLFTSWLVFRCWRCFILFITISWRTWGLLAERKVLTMRAAGLQSIGWFVNLEEVTKWMAYNFSAGIVASNPKPFLNKPCM